MTKNPRILFFGTPEFAVASLNILVNKGCQVIGVVTAPDKPAGRGKHLSCSPVKQYALQHGLYLMQPGNLKDPAFHEELRKLNADIQVVVAFRMLPKEVWEIPSLGTFNLHASLLPQYRGAAPINWAIINGETETGVSTFFIDESIDTGKIIFSEYLLIQENESAGELHDRLMLAGADLVLKTVEAISAHSVKVTEQEFLISPGITIKKAPKILKEHCRIEWNNLSKDVCNLVRGMSPYPGAFTELIDREGNSRFLKIYKTLPEISHTGHTPGNIFTDGKTFIKVAVKDGFIHLLEVQLPGRKVMNTVEFLNGFGRYFS
jgi:methionyl-tRNA formyltransferase